jgi:hypothetical protein
MVQNFWLQILVGVCAAFFQTQIDRSYFLAEQRSYSGKLLELLCFSLGQIIAQDSPWYAWLE